MGRKKGFIIVGLTALAALLLAAGPLCAQPLGIMSQQPQKEPHKGSLRSDQGRFVFGQISDSTKDQFMLDTHTGRLWRISETGRIGLFLQTVPYKASDGSYTDLPASSLKPAEAEDKEKK